MYEIIENQAIKRLWKKEGSWQLLEGWIVPVLLALAATLIKKHLFSGTDYAAPFLLYIAVILLSGCYGGGRSALAAITAITIFALLFLRGLERRSYLLAEWLLFGAEALLITFLFYFIEHAFLNLAKKEKRFERIIDQSAEGFILFDETGAISYCCPWAIRWLKILDVQPQFKELVDARDRGHYNFSINRLKQNGGSMILQLRLKQGKNESVWAECCFNNLLNDSLVKSVIVQLRDVTAKVNLEKQKEDFIHMASHELKTPVTAIKGFLQVGMRKLKNGVAGDIELLLHRADAQTSKMIKMVDEMLNATRIAAGELVYQLKSMEIQHCIKEAVAAVQAGITTHQIDVLMPLDPVYVCADTGRISQVITNMLTNAAKYSPGHNKVQLSLEQGEGQIRVSVQDYGIGIPADKLKRVFDRFYRANNLPKNKFEGLGLGLFIAADIVRHHRGQIGVDSKDGQGSTFWFTLPAQAVPSSAQS